MTVRRLTTVSEVIRLWPFFAMGLTRIAKYLRYSHSLDTYRKILFDQVKREDSWVGVCFLSGEPVAFAVIHNCSPLFSSIKEMEVSLFLHLPDLTDATLALQAEFEKWGRKQGVSKYYVTTRQDSGAAIRCFKSPQYGFHRAYTVLSKSL